jgi:RNA polymerase sigma factor (sigma-70 family)
MAVGQLNKVIQHLRTVLERQDTAGITDAALLKRYIHERDEAAFEALLRRHGPMVLGVCHRVLRNRHDAEDAFQATFLVLVRKASTLRSPATIGHWLYGVAYRTALHARDAAAKRRAKEAKVVPQTGSWEDTWADLRPVLDQELDRLPEKYRMVLVLCDLEGKTRKEAARQLRWPEGTVASRLASARTILAKRLSRYRLAVCSAALAEMLSQNASAYPPASVVSSTIKAAGLYAAGPAAGFISVKVASLTEGVLKSMLLTKLKVIPAVLLVVGVLGLGVGVGGLLHQIPAAEAKALAYSSPSKAKSVHAQVPARRASGKELGWHVTLEMRHDHPVTVIACSPAWSAAGDAGGNLFLWDTQTGKNRKLLSQGTNSVDRLQFTSDGKHLFAVVDERRSLARFDLNDKPSPGVGSRIPIFLGVSADGATWLESHRAGRTLALRPNPWNQPKTPDFETVDYEADISHALVSADDKHLAVVTKDGNLHLHDRASRQKTHTIALNKGVVVTAVQFSPNGERIAVACDDSFARIFGTSKGEEVAILKGHRGIVFTIAFSPDGKQVVTGGDDTTARVWDAATGKSLAVLESHTDSVRCAAFDPSEETLVTGSADKTVKVWRLDKGPKKAP